MRIGELSEHTGTPRRLLRYYEEQGLIVADRLPNGYRVYDASNVDRVMQIRGLLDAGLPTRIIKQILPCLNKPRIIHFPDATPEMLATLEDERDRMTERIRCLTRNRDAVAEYLAAVRETPAPSTRPPLSGHSGGALQNGLPDAVVGPAAADVADRVEVGLGDLAPGLPGPADLRHGGHDLPGLAVAALGDVEVEPGLLHRVELAPDGVRETLDGGDLVVLREILDGHGAGRERLAVEVARTGPADADPAAVLGTGDAEDVPEDPEEPDVALDVGGDGLAVQDEGVLRHGCSRSQSARSRPSVGEAGTGGTVGRGVKASGSAWLTGKTVGIVPVARP